jgi:hypothetical protein
MLEGRPLGVSDALEEEGELGELRASLEDGDHQSGLLFVQSAVSLWPVDEQLERADVQTDAHRSVVADTTERKRWPRTFSRKVRSVRARLAKDARGVRSSRNAKSVAMSASSFHLAYASSMNLLKRVGSEPAE